MFFTVFLEPLHSTSVPSSSPSIAYTPTISLTRTERKAKQTEVVGGLCPLPPLGYSVASIHPIA
jgi:hypothetical protein